MDDYSYLNGNLCEVKASLQSFIRGGQVKCSRKLGLNSDAVIRWIHRLYKFEDLDELFYQNTRIMHGQPEGVLCDVADRLKEKNIRLKKNHLPFF